MEALNQLQTDTQFMTIGRAPRLSTFRSEPITSVQDKHYVQGFFYHEPEPAEEHIFQGDQSFLHNVSPMGTLRGKRTYGFHDYSKNWEVVDQGKEKKGKDKAGKNKIKSKLCVVM